MTLHRELFRELVEILTYYYGFENEARRRATLLSAGLRDLIKQLDLSGETAAFIPLLLERLDSYGVDDDGIPALAHLLQYIASQVGNPNRATLQRICQQIAPPRSLNQAERMPDVPPPENGDAPPIWDVFICYAREDLSMAKRLHDDLERAGVAVWLDKKKLVVGQNWKFEVKKAMQRSRYILTLLSSHSVSKSGYVQKELLEALEMLAHLPPDRILIIPVRLDDCEPTHEQLHELQWLDLFESYEDGLRDILSLFYGWGTGWSPLRNMMIDLADNVKIELIAIPGGKFLMGQTSEELNFLRLQNLWNDCFNNERPRHQVTLAPFFMGKYPVTQAQWQAIMGNNPSHFKGADRPVEGVSWDDVQAFLQTLNATVGALHVTPLQFRLPTEAEWEYVCRAGSDTAYSFGDDPAQLGEYAWFNDNSGDQTHPVGQKAPNAWGFYDMHGNVLEWCMDTWHDDYQNAPNDGRMWGELGDKKAKLLRGGSWYNRPYYVRCAYRNWFDPDNQDDDFGFRVVVVR